jgi:four helix bundle protein
MSPRDIKKILNRDMQMLKGFINFKKPCTRTSTCTFTCTLGYAHAYRTKEIMMLDHENLDVYQRAIDFFALCVQIMGKIPRGNSFLADQLKRASLSIPLNIAEGAGKISLVDKQKFYAIARGSAMESAAILDACKILGLVESGVYERGKDLLNRVVSMLTRMCNF